MRMNPYRGPVPTPAQSLLLANAAKKDRRKLKGPTLPFTTIFKYAKRRDMQKKMAGPLKSDMNWPVSLHYNSTERRLVFVLVPKEYFSKFRRIAIGRFKKPFATHLTVGVVKRTKGPLIIHSISIPVERAEEIIRAVIRAKGGSKTTTKSVKMTPPPKSVTTRLKQAKALAKASPKKKAPAKKKAPVKKRASAKKRAVAATPLALEKFKEQLGPFSKWLNEELQAVGLPAANPKDTMAYYQVYQMAPVQANPMGGYHPSPQAHAQMAQNTMVTSAAGNPFQPPVQNPLLMSVMMNPGMNDPMFEERFMSWVTAQQTKKAARPRAPRNRRALRNPATNPGRNPIGKKGKNVPVKQFEAWLRRNGSEDQIKRYESAVKAYMKFHKGAKPRTVVRYEENVGDPRDGYKDMEFEYSMGKSPAEIYTTPKHSGKAPYSYIHDYETLPQVTSTAGGQRVTKRFHGTKTHVSDWIHG